RRVEVVIRSRHGDVTTASRPKSGFPSVSTLHAVVAAPSDPDLDGTEVRFVGVSDHDVATAQSFFLRYSGAQTLESTRYGEVLAKPAADQPGQIYVKG